MTPDGFFKSGDIGIMDAEGYVRIVDRKKDMIVVLGFKVFSNEIEGVVAHHPITPASWNALPLACRTRPPVRR